MSSITDESVENTLTIASIDIEKEIQRIMVLMEKESDKKLEVVRHYLLRHHGVRIGISEVEDLITFLRSDEADDDIFIGLYDELDQTFSKGYPNFIFEYKLKDRNTFNELKEKIDLCLPIDIEKNYKDDSFIFIKRIGNVSIIDDCLLKFPVTYEKFKEQTSFGGGKIMGESEIKTSFDVVFDSTQNLCYIQCGDRNHSNATHKVIQKHVTNMFETFIPFSVINKKRNTVVENEYELDKQTIILLDYIEESININGHEINDYLNVAFSNKRQDKKIRSVRLGGNNLLESFEVGDRIRLGDQIKSVRFQLRFKTNSDTFEIVNVSIDFQATIKIQYTNIQNTMNVFLINRHLITTLTNSLNKLYEEQEVLENLRTIIAKAKVRDSIFLTNVLGKVKDDINQLSLVESDRLTVLGVINRYITEE
ncbi:hypothetical protein ACFWM3_19115 [Gottfriedia sp. NPDC058432]|uniref:hypothetical protein n=1 Tax=Gottfriedia sp. NPDC058432 TaxID=3346497 RepID=UPI00366A01FD